MWADSVLMLMTAVGLRLQDGQQLIYSPDMISHRPGQLENCHLQRTEPPPNELCWLARLWTGSCFCCGLKDKQKPTGLRSHSWWPKVVYISNLQRDKWSALKKYTQYLTRCVSNNVIDIVNWVTVVGLLRLPELVACVMNCPSITVIKGWKAGREFEREAVLSKLHSVPKRSCKLMRRMPGLIGRGEAGVWTGGH